VTGIFTPGGFGSRMDQPWTSNGAVARRRRESAQSGRPEASPSEAVTPPSREAMQRAIEADTCPFCGSGPYKNLGLHSHKAHGVSAAELRDLSGLKTVCSEGLSTGSRERLVGRPDRDEITHRGAQVAKEKGVQSIALQASMEPRLAAMKERDPVIIRRACAGDRLIDIAADLGITTATVQRSLQRLGIAPTLAQANAERRQRLDSNREAARATRGRKAAEDRAWRLRRFAELGGGWEAVESLANECGVSEKAMRAYLRDAGAEVPDGRSVTHRRPTERPEARGKPNHAARSVTDAQIEEIRQLARETTLSQKKIGELFGVSQSIVWRVLNGKYVG